MMIGDHFVHVIETLNLNFKDLLDGRTRSFTVTHGMKFLRQKDLSLATALFLTLIYLFFFPINLFYPGSVNLKFSTSQSSKSSLVSQRPWKYPLCPLFLEVTNDKQNPCSWKALNGRFKYHLRQLENKTVALVGDSRVRHMFTYLKSMLDHRHFLFRDSFNDTIYSDEKRNISVVRDWMQHFYARWFPNEDMFDLLEKWTRIPRTIPQYIFFESGAWPLFRYGLDGLETFKKNLTLVAKKFTELRNYTTVVWMKTLPFHPDAESGHGLWIKMTNGSACLEEYSAAFEAVGRANSMTMWTSAYVDAKKSLETYMDHVHPGTALIRKAICQLLLSLDHKSCEQHFHKEKL